MGDLSRLWIQWRGGTTWNEVEVRTVSVRAAFAFLPDPPPAGSQGVFEVRSESGEVSRRGVCRVVFVRPGVGAGLELRRGVSPASSSSIPPVNDPPPPSSHFRRPKSGAAARESEPPKRRAPSAPPSRPRPSRPITKPERRPFPRPDEAITDATRRPAEGSKPARPSDRPTGRPEDLLPRSERPTSRPDLPVVELQMERPTSRPEMPAIEGAEPDAPIAGRSPAVDQPITEAERRPETIDQPITEAERRPETIDQPITEAHASSQAKGGPDTEAEGRSPRKRTPTPAPALDFGELELDLGPRSGLGSKPPPELALDLDDPPPAASDDEDPDDLRIDLDAELEGDPSSYGAGYPSLDPPSSPHPDIASLPPIDLDEPIFPKDAALPSIDDDRALPPADAGADFGLPDLEPAPPPEPPAPAFENYERAVRESQRPPRESSQPPGSPTGGDEPVRIETRTRGRGTTEGFAIGIDLGTSNTCASVVLDGVPQVIPTRYGTHTVPSVYAQVGHRVLVGEPAVKRMVLDPGETIYGSKRLIGRAYTDAVAFDYQPYFAYQLAETRDHRFGAAIDGEVVSFEEVATALLEEVRDVASRFLDGPIDRAVITVPAYFTEVQREAVKRSARAARIMVDQLVPEPTAAALAFGHHSSRKGTYVVFDLGGGTFDISVMRASDGDFEVLAIGGDPFLGGIDIDDMIANYLLEELHRELRVKIDPTPQQLARLREVAEECKRGLSVQESFAVSLKHFAEVDGRPSDLNATVSRAVLEELAEPFVSRLLEISRETVAAAGLEPDDVHELILVGGMSRMPLVHQRVEELFHRRADRKTNPDEAVAIGAALLASRIREVRLVDVLPLSIGIAGEGRRFLRLVPRNTSLPTTKSFVVRTEEEGQTRYELPLYQGERRDATRNEYLGTLIIDGLVPREAGRQIDLELHLDDHAVLSVVARDGVTGSALDVALSRELSATEAKKAHGSYEGAADSSDERLASPLGRFFQKVRGFFTSSSG